MGAWVSAAAGWEVSFWGILAGILMLICSAILIVIHHLSSILFLHVHFLVAWQRDASLTYILMFGLILQIILNYLKFMFASTIYISIRCLEINYLSDPEFQIQFSISSSIFCLAIDYMFLSAALCVLS